MTVTQGILAILCIELAMFPEVDVDYKFHENGSKQVKMDNHFHEKENFLM